MTFEQSDFGEIYELKPLKYRADSDSSYHAWIAGIDPRAARAVTAGTETHMHTHTRTDTLSDYCNLHVHAQRVVKYQTHQPFIYIMFMIKNMMQSEIGSIIVVMCMTMYIYSCC